LTGCSECILFLNRGLAVSRIENRWKQAIFFRRYIQSVRQEILKQSGETGIGWKESATDGAVILTLQVDAVS